LELANLLVNLELGGRSHICSINLLLILQDIADAVRFFVPAPFVLAAPFFLAVLLSGRLSACSQNGPPPVAPDVH
jgi:hypothetical protein